MVTINGLTLKMMLIMSKNPSVCSVFSVVNNPFASLRLCMR